MPIENNKVAIAVAKAAEVNRSIKLLMADLEGFKDIIRKEAEKVQAKRGTNEQVEFMSLAGTAIVVFVSDAVSAVDGANLAELRDKLPKVTFGDLFQETITLADGFSSKFDMLKKGHQTVVGRYVEWKFRAPRVILPK